MSKITENIVRPTKVNNNEFIELNKKVGNTSLTVYSRFNRLYKLRQGGTRGIYEEYNLKVKKDEIEWSPYSTPTDMECKIYCLLKILDRDGIEYKNSIATGLKSKLSDWYNKNKLTDQERDIIKSNMVNEVNNNELKRMPTSFPKILIKHDQHRSLEVIQDTEYIYESRNWTKKMKEKIIQNYYHLIYKALSDIVNAGLKVKENEKELISTALQDMTNYSIAYKIWNMKINNREISILYLVDLIEEKDKDKNINSLNNPIFSINSLVKKEEIDQLSSITENVYPSFILASYDKWIYMQGFDDDKGNLALSFEEHKLMASLNLPFFLVGRAGSGKSTMLYYIFSYAEKYFESVNSDELEKYLKNDSIFLTYSEKLKIESEIKVKKLISSDEGIIHKEIPENYKFYSFEEFLKENIISDKQKYLKELNIKSYEFINEFFNKKYITRSFNGETCWHVIRSLIKGKKTDGLLSADDYNKLPSDDKCVSEEIFEDIRENIYKSYEDWKLRKNYWDDMDLVRESMNIINKKLSKGEKIKRYFWIFCDEAQDFTQVELSLLIKINYFTQFNLNNVNYIPMVFAGDQIQTINPTGFNWDRLKADFYNEITKIGGNKIELKDAPLSKNYRTGKDILKLANLILGLRNYLLDETTKMQEPWHDYASTPKYYDIESMVKYVEASDENKDYFKNNIFIVSHKTYRENKDTNNMSDEFLKIVNPTLQTVFDSKGLEYDNVILYNLFDDDDKNLLEMINKKKQGKEIKDDEKIALAYILSILYVSVTRARRNLLIIDTKEHINNFWKIMIDNGELIQLIKNNNSSKVLGGLIKGNNRDLAIIKLSKDKKKELAKELLNKGILNSNPENISQSINLFKELREKDKILKGKLEIAKIRKDYLTVGELYKEEGKLREAIIYWFWGEKWGIIINEFKLNKDYNNSMEYLVAVFMNANNPTEKQLQKMLESEFLMKIEMDRRVWIHILDKIYNSLNKNHWISSIRFLDKLFEKQKRFNDIRIKYLVEMEDYQTAVHLCSKKNQIRECYIARGYTSTEIKDRIMNFDKIDFTDQIIDIYMESKKTNKHIEETTMKIIWKHISKTNYIDDNEKIQIAINNSLVNEADEMFISGIRNGTLKIDRLQSYIDNRVINNPDKLHEIRRVVYEKSIENKLREELYSKIAKSIILNLPTIEWHYLEKYIDLESISYCKINEEIIKSLIKREIDYYQREKLISDKRFDETRVFIRELLINKGFRERVDINFREICMVFEKTQTYIDIKNFYRENLKDRKSKYSKELLEFIKTRYLRNELDLTVYNLQKVNNKINYQNIRKISPDSYNKYIKDPLIKYGYSYEEIMQEPEIPINKLKKVNPMFVFLKGLINKENIDREEVIRILMGNYLNWPLLELKDVKTISVDKFKGKAIKSEDKYSAIIYTDKIEETINIFDNLEEYEINYILFTNGESFNFWIDGKTKKLKTDNKLNEIVKILNDYFTLNKKTNTKS